MALRSDAAMILFYDIEGDTADHDDWHSFEHFHERLSVPGFLRATRWLATGGGPRTMVTYEVEGVDVATSPAYLERLNKPSAWTRELMPRFRGMTRGFCRIAASAGFGLGRDALVARFLPEAGEEGRLADWLSGSVLADMASRRGMTGAQFLIPEPPSPMTEEQRLRGADRAMPWLVIATGYDPLALEAAGAAHLPAEALAEHGAAEIEFLAYSLHLTADREEAARTPKPPDLEPEVRGRSGARR